jgi:hypothetical protein
MPNSPFASACRLPTHRDKRISRIKTKEWKYRKILYNNEHKNQSKTRCRTKKKKRTEKEGNRKEKEDGFWKLFEDGGKPFPRVISKPAPEGWVS